MVKKDIIIYDGVCKMCNAFFRWVHKNDKKNVFMFTNFQSNYTSNKMDILKDSNSIAVILADGTVLRKINAIKHVLKETKKLLKSNIIGSVKTFLRAEFINRLDEILFFTKLTRNNIKVIAEIQLKELNERLNEMNISLTWDESVVNLITLEGYNPEYGARPIKRTIRYLIEDKISDLILKEELENKVIKLKEIDGYIELKLN